jgi:hypothetical protein
VAEGSFEGQNTIAGTRNPFKGQASLGSRMYLSIQRRTTGCVRIKEREDKGNVRIKEREDERAVQG